VLLNGSLYGTTDFGGETNDGCVFKVQLPSGTESVLYSFQGGSNDGSEPQGLTVLNGLLYGITSAGGADNVGTVFEVNENGTERVLHSFKDSEGSNPIAPLMVLNGVLYGTTFRGGAHGAGTAFGISPDGKFNRLHDFDGKDGSGPAGRLALGGGNSLVGTTQSGGDSNNGTVFVLPLHP
jgi:uncharacterized repeat protein (TIGR03803 family)